MRVPQVFAPSPSDGAIEEFNKHVERFGERFEKMSPSNFINEKMEVGHHDDFGVYFERKPFP